MYFSLWIHNQLWFFWIPLLTSTILHWVGIINLGRRGILGVQQWWWNTECSRRHADISLWWPSFQLGILYNLMTRHNTIIQGTISVAKSRLKAHVAVQTIVATVYRGFIHTSKWIRGRIPTTCHRCISSTSHGGTLTSKPFTDHFLIDVYWVTFYG